MTSPGHKGSALCSRAEGGQGGIEVAVRPKVWVALSHALGGHFPGKAQAPSWMVEILSGDSPPRRLCDMV